MSTLEPRTHALVEGGLERGYARRRRARLIQLGSTGAVLSAITALTLVVLPGSSDGRRPAGAGLGGSATAQGPSGAWSLGAAPPATSPVLAATSAAPDAMVDVTPQALLQTAIDTLPRAGSTGAYSGNFFAGWAHAGFVYDDGAGPAEVDIVMAFRPGVDEAQTPCTVGTAGCTLLADGGHLLVRQGREYSDARRPNSTEWSATLVRGDGVEITIGEFNAPQEKDAALTRADPPFTLAQLTTWVDASDWTPQITLAREQATDGLFTPADVDAAGPGKSEASATGQARDCLKAAKMHSAPPAGCHS